MKAAQLGFVEIVLFLLESGSNVNEQDEVRSVVLFHILIISSVFGICELLCYKLHCLVT